MARYVASSPPSAAMRHSIIACQEGQAQCRLPCKIELQSIFGRRKKQNRASVHEKMGIRWPRKQPRNPLTAVLFLSRDGHPRYPPKSYGLKVDFAFRTLRIWTEARFCIALQEGRPRLGARTALRRAVDGARYTAWASFSARSAAASASMTLESPSPSRTPL